VVVIGAGMSGLAAAHRIVTRAAAAKSTRPLEVIVLEARDRVGGALWTERRDGFLLEAGADSFITNKPWGVELCDELRLTGQLLETDARYRRSFVVRGGKLLPVPDGFVMMAPSKIGPLLTTPTLSIRGKMRLLLDLVVPRGTAGSDESVAAFVKRRLGREALERLVQPLVGGIYTADPNELSLKATLPQFAQLEKDHRSLILAAIRNRRPEPSLETASSGARYGLFVTPSEGMGSLAIALAESLPRDCVRLATPVRRVSRPSPTSPWVIDLFDGPPIEAGSLVLATEAHASARLVDGFDPELARQLRAIPYASSAIVSLGYRRDQVAHPLDGFGAVVPAVERRSILAVSFTSVKFPARAPFGTVLLRAFVGGATQPELFDLDDVALESLARRELGELLGARGDPLLVEISRHPRAMPQYTLGHLERVAAIRKEATKHPALALAGNAFDGVGVPDCIRSGREAADAILGSLLDAARRAVA
jgi:oxygen-dependent protoporphyrinogen oxidase